VSSDVSDMQPTSNLSSERGKYTGLVARPITAAGRLALQALSRKGPAVLHCHIDAFAAMGGKTELEDDRLFPTRQAARTALFDFIDGRARVTQAFAWSFCRT
jgi:hypothetical protein